jgi:hypothetical protein
MLDWWKDPRLGTDDDEGAYDYYAEELPQDHSEWSRYPTRCGDCGKERRLHVTHYHYFYCWHGWDSMDYSVCWKCYLKSTISSIMSKVKEYIRKHTRKFHIRAYVVFRKYCKKHNIPKTQFSRLWTSHYDFWVDKANYKFLKGEVNR